MKSLIYESAEENFYENFTDNSLIGYGETAVFVENGKQNIIDIFYFLFYICIDISGCQIFIY